MEYKFDLEGVASGETVATECLQSTTSFIQWRKKDEGKKRNQSQFADDSLKLVLSSWSDMLNLMSKFRSQVLVNRSHDLEFCLRVNREDLKTRH